MPGGGLSFGVANGVRGSVFVGASPARAPRVLPLSFPKFAHKREAVTCSVRSHAAWMSQGPSHEAWAVWGPVGCVGAIHTPQHPSALMELRSLGGMANGGWLGVIHSTSCPVWEQPRESIVLPHWFGVFLVSKSGKMLLVFIFLT